MIMFDLPTKRKKDKKRYHWFHDELAREGYVMIQSCQGQHDSYFLPSPQRVVASSCGIVEDRSKTSDTVDENRKAANSIRHSEETNTGQSRRRKQQQTRGTGNNGQIRQTQRRQANL